MLNQTFYLKETQKVPISIHEAWSFFSNPLNLKEITPPHLNLVVTNEMPEKMHAGMIITYVVEPLLKIKSIKDKLLYLKFDFSKSYFSSR